MDVVLWMKNITIQYGYNKYDAIIGSAEQE